MKAARWCPAVHLRSYSYIVHLLLATEARGRCQQTSRRSDGHRQPPSPASARAQQPAMHWLLAHSVLKRRRAPAPRLAGSRGPDRCPARRRLGT